VSLEEELKSLIVEGLNLKGMTPAQISDDMPIFGEGIGLDSLDAVELIVLLKRRYGAQVLGLEENREAMRSVRSLAEFIRSQTGGGAS